MSILSHHRSTWLLAVGLLCLSTLACSLVIPATPTPVPTATAIPTEKPTDTPFPPTPTETPIPTATDTSTPLPPTETAIPTSTPTDTATPTPAVSYLIAEIEPSQGTLAEQLKEHAAQAQALGLTAYVEFTATWCPACQAIKESLDDENELMVDAFQGTYIIPVDIDVWTEDDWVAAGFEIEFIPIYFEIDEAGQPTGENIGGDAWGDNIPENMAPPLKEFFQAHAAVR